MTTLTLTSIIMVSAAMMKTTGGACDYTKCTDKFDKSRDLDKFCSGASEAFSCIDSTSKNNPDCASVKTTIDDKIAMPRQLFESMCSDTSECNLHACLKMISTNLDLESQCRSSRDATACFESTLTYNKACSSSRQMVESILDRLRNGQRGHCRGGAAVHTSSIVFCLGLTAMIYFLPALK